MKIWNAFGTEHSMNLVMIGRFKTIECANKAKQALDSLTDFMINQHDSDQPPTRFGDALGSLLEKEEVYSIGLRELVQFRYDVHVQQTKDHVVIKTDEADISAFLKVLIDKGARVEIYSLHDHPDASQSEDGSRSPS